MNLKPPSDDEIKKMMPLGEDYSRHENEAYCFGLIEIRDQWKSSNEQIVKRLHDIANSITVEGEWTAQLDQLIKDLQP